MPTLVWYCRTFLVFHAYNHNVDKKGHQTYYLEEKKLHVSQNRTEAYIICSSIFGTVPNPNKSNWKSTLVVID